MKTQRNFKVFSLMVLLMAFGVNAKLAQPDYVLYGVATWFGQPLGSDTEITIFLDNQQLTVAKYSIGTEPNLGGLYALRIPMDDVDPRTHGKARPGDPASIFMNGNLVATIVVGQYGVAERLDLDPANSTVNNSVINLVSAEMAEGQSGTSLLNIEVNLSEATNSDVTVDWTTSDLTAMSDDNCGFDVDYIDANNTVTIPAQSTEANIQVEICGDTIIESSETFEVILSNPNNAIIQFDRATQTILDDDGYPELRGYDMVVFEPSSGSLIQAFQLKLSQAYQQDVRFDYTTVSGSATSPDDFTQTSGFIIIPAGTQQVEIPVEFFADALTENIEILTLQLSNVSNAQLITANLTAFIMDANSEEQTEQDSDLDNSTIPQLISPSDVVISSDDSHVYVSSLDGDGSILHFTFDQGDLNYVSAVDISLSNFEQGYFKKIRQIVISPNGEFLYAAASADHAISIFSINSNSRELTFVGSVSEPTPSNLAMQKVYGLAISPDGKNLYAVGSESDSVVVFSIDEVTGLLTHLESEIQGVDDPDDSGTSVVFMDRPIRLEVSADGKNVYVAADFSSSIAVFDRDSVTGKLSYKESLKSGVSGVANLGGASALQCSIDGNHVYALGRADNSVVIFDRDVNGALTYSDSLTQSVPDFIGLDSPVALEINFRDDRLYALGIDDSTLVTFKRQSLQTEADYGDLTFADFEQDGIGDVNKMNGPISLAMTSDGAWIIVAAAIDNSLVVFETPKVELIFKNGFE